MGPSSREITLQDALDTIQGGNQKNRADGISQLKQIFQHNHKSPILNDSLKDGSYHSIFEALFKVARVEKQAYLTAKNLGQKTRAEQVLNACSDVLRIAIREGADKLKPKTVKAVIEHVTQLLPAASGEYCAGLSKFYLKVLGSILEHEAHVEHLEEADWLSTVDFCLQGIVQYGSDSAGEPVHSSRDFPRSTSSSAQTSSTKLSVRSRGVNSSNSITKRNSEELLQCLLCLVSASNAPILERAENILNGIMHFLESHDSFASPIHQVAFSAINFMLSATNTDKTSLSQSVALRLVPIIGHLWSSKSVAKDEMLNSIKDEMLITVLRLRLHMEQIISTHEGSFEQKLEELERILWTDYSKRLERDQLQLDDLDMSTLSGENIATTSIFVGFLRLKTHAPRAERSWAILAALSILDNLLNFNQNIQVLNAGHGDNDEGDSSKHHRKRRRIARRFDGLMELVSSEDVRERLVAFQVLLFLLPSSTLSQQDLDKVLAHLSPCIIDRRNNIGSWAMLCIASCTGQDVLHNNSCLFGWGQLWHTAAKLCSNPATCRAACYLLHTIMAYKLVSYRDVADDVDAMLTTTEINAPVILSDSSLSLMTHLLNLRNMEVPGGSLAVCHHIIRWISARCDPTEISFAARCAIDVHPIDILNLLRTGLDLPTLRLSSRKQAPSGIIGQAWAQDLGQEGMIRYLLLREGSQAKEIRCLNCVSVSGIHESARLSDNSAHGLSARRLILELFLPKFRSLMDEWESHSTQDSTQVSTDTSRCTASMCVLGCLFLSFVKDPHLLQLQEQLQGTLSSLTTSLLAQLREAQPTQSLMESMLQAIQPYLPGCNSAELTHIYQQNPRLLNFFDQIMESLKLRLALFEEVTIIRVDDPMDVDDMFETQRSRSGGSESRERLVRRDLPMAMSPAAFYSTTVAQLALVSTTWKANNAPARVSPKFIDHLISLNPKETLLCRQMIQDVLRSDLLIQPEDLSRLFEHVGKILTSPEYDCFEVALGLCLDMLTSLVSAWAHPEGDVVEYAIDLYKWLIGVVLPKRRPSTNVQIGLSCLLNELMRVHPSYGEASKLPSVRSCLLDILQKAAIPVKFYIAEKLPSFFGLFVLKHHKDILDDVLQSLPSDLCWAEGIAFRLKVLSSLASKWPTLIRRCTYYILEVPGQLSGSMKHATRCLADVSRALGLQDTGELFQLFASQLLYTWLHSEPIEKIPFEIFGYNTLKEFIKDNKEEITALMTMRGQDDEVIKVAQLLGISIEGLLQQCFSKVIAYSVAHDISIPRSADTKKYVTGEARVRKQVGKEVFFDLVHRQFADIVALFFNLIDQEEQIVKNPNLFHAVETLNYIKSISSSEVSLPPNQQPAFKAKYLTSEIEFLCGRTEYEVTNLYNSAMVVFIARRIVNTIHPALGSLHACAVLRKLRVLIALSGETALQGYPTEMLLQAVRPFITDSECANDAIGITQYLLDRATPYLSKSPSFVAGISLTILASLRAFLESSPASTTQQSQYISTLSRAQSFQMWLGSYLAKYESSALKGPSEVAFRTIIQSAHTFRAAGSAEIGSAEGELLMELFDDERSGRPF